MAVRFAHCVINLVYFCFACRLDLSGEKTSLTSDSIYIVTGSKLETNLASSYSEAVPLRKGRLPQIALQLLDAKVFSFDFVVIFSDFHLMQEHRQYQLQASHHDTIGL